MGWGFGARGSLVFAKNHLKKIYSSTQPQNTHTPSLFSSGARIQVGYFPSSRDSLPSPSLSSSPFINLQ